MEVKSIEGYVPNMLQIDDEGFGDYVIMTINEDGVIANWEVDFVEFQNEEE